MKVRVKTKERAAGKFAAPDTWIAKLETSQAECRLAKEESRKFKTICDRAGYGVSIASLEGKLTYVNDSYARMHAYRPDELIGQHYSILYTEESLKRLKRLRHKLLQEGIFFAEELWRRKKDGTIFPSLTTAGIIKNDAGEPLYISATAIDITKHKRAEEALKESEQRYRALFESTLDGVFVIDAETMKVVLANEAAANIFGFDSAEDVIGVSPLDFVPPDDRERVIRIIAEDMFARDLRQISEFRVVTRDGREIWIRAVGVRTEYQGRLAGLVSFWDITEHKRAEEALRRNRDYLEKLNNSLPEVILTVRLPERIIEYVNHSVETIFGYKPEECLGQTTEMLYPSREDYLEASERREAATRWGKSGTETERLLRRKNGEMFPSHVITTFLKEGAKVTHVISVIRDITEHKRVEEELQRNYHTQTVLNALLHISMLDIPLENQLELILEHMLSIPWLTIESRGAIFLAEDEPEVLVMKAQRGLATPLQNTCARVPLGKCVCGRAALSDKTEFVERVDDRHEIQYEGIVPHGHYCVPILSAGKLLGVINMYLKEGHRREQKEEEFLTAVANTLAGIIERKRAEEALRESEERYRALLELGTRVGEAVAMLQDTEKGIGIYTFVSDEWTRITGYSREELLNMSMTDLIHPRYREAAMERYKRRLQGETIPGLFELSIIRKDGTEVPIEITSAFTTYRGKRANVVYIRDITERKKMQQQLMITDRLASIGELASGIAHELNNPLTGIIGFSELALGKDVPDDVKEDLKVISRESQRTANIVKNFLTFARKHPPERKPVQINGVIEEVVKLRTYEQKVHNIEVVTQFSPDLPPVLADSFQLQQVFLNIIINAEHFMTEAHERGTLTITTERTGDVVRISLADDGPGISQENLGHLFDPFFTTKKEGKGTGLGLSICHGIIAEHGGRIYAESEPGKGATFIIELPIMQP